MKFSKMTIEYAVTRSKDYQSVRVGAVVEVEVAEGEDKAQAFDRTRLWIAEQVTAAAAEEIERVVYGEGCDMVHLMTDDRALCGKAPALYFTLDNLQNARDFVAEPQRCRECYAKAASMVDIHSEDADELAAKVAADALHDYHRGAWDLPDLLRAATQRVIDTLRERGVR